MAHVIGLKKHLFALVQTKHGLKKIEIKSTSSDHKLKDKIVRHIGPRLEAYKGSDGSGYDSA